MYHRDFLAVAAIYVAVGLMLTWVIRAVQYEKVWFDYRALADGS